MFLLGAKAEPACCSLFANVPVQPHLLRAIYTLVWGFACHTDCSYFEEHPLRTTLGRTLEGDKTIARIPIYPVSVCVRNDTAASHSISNSEYDLESLGNEGMPKPFSRESPVYGKLREQN